MKTTAGRIAVPFAATFALVFGVAGAASAHVTVAAPEAAVGDVGEITFTVPTESETASTTAVSVQLPTKTPLSTVAIKPVPGWNATTKKTHLAQPIKTDDGANISDVISEITWTAAAGQESQPGQYQTFSISAGPLPKVSTLVFPTVQTYSDGTTVAWIDPTIAGQPEPQHPAPTLHLTGTASQPGASNASASTTASSTGSSSALQITTLIVAILALLAALAALGLALATRRGQAPRAS